MRQDDIREIIIPPLNEFLGVPVIESNQRGSVPDQPHFSFTFTSTDLAEGGEATIYEAGAGSLTKAREREAQTVLSLTSIVDVNQFNGAAAAMRESNRLTAAAFDWITFYGEDLMMAAGIALVNVSAIANRNGIDDEEYRRGFDVTLRTRSRLEQDIDYFDTVVINEEA